MLVFRLFSCAVFADDTSGEEVQRRLAARAVAAFEAARERHLEDTNHGEAAWQFGRAAFDLAEYATNNAQRTELAMAGIAATRALILAEPELAAAYYYLGMNLGQLARTRTLGALKLVDEMEAVFKRARELEPDFDFAGPDRYLGQLYRDAPGWPASIGSNLQARQHLLRAARRAPEYPDNRLSLAESLVQWGESALARKELDAIRDLWPKARLQFTGDAWEASWVDWEKRLAQLERKIAGTLPKDGRLKRGRIP